MILAKNNTGGSFYESFSDLIFGTLVLFIVVVLALALKVQAATVAIIDGGSGLLSMSSYSGSATPTEMIFTTLPRDQKNHFVPVPENLSRLWGLNQTSTTKDGLLEFCKWAMSDGVLAIPVEDLEGMGSGFGAQLKDGLIFHYNIGEALFLVDEVRRREGGSLKGWSAVRLRKEISGASRKKGPTIQLKPRSQKLDQAQQRYRTWSKHGGEHLFYREAEARNALEASATASADARISLTVDENGRGLQVGDRHLEVDELTALLRAIRTGRGFVLDVQPGVNATDKSVIEFRREVLAPVGFDVLVVRPAQDLFSS